MFISGKEKKDKYRREMSKVCMLTTNHSPFDNRIFYKEARSLKNAGYDVTVIGHMDSKRKGEVDNIMIIGIEKKVNIKLYLPLLRKLLKEALKINAEIYHCHEPESFLVAIYLKIFKRKKIIYDVHEYYIDVLPLSSPQRRMFLGFMLYLVEPLFCSYFDVIITTDEGIAKRYKKFNKKVYPLINFPSFEIFKPSNNQYIKKKYENCEVIIYVGGMSEERGILELIKAAHRISNTYPLVKLLLLGTFGTKDFEDKCTGYVKSNDINENVEFLGFVPHKEIPKYINAADVGTVLLHPTTRFIKTAYPIKLFEYMICGKPVIASNLSAMGKIVKESECGILVDPTDIDEITEAIIYLIEHQEEAKKMGENGRRAVEDKYNWDEMEKRLLKIYEEI
jgi:glycosyltransferase involved in cell wall biosynthesis